MRGLYNMAISEVKQLFKDIMYFNDSDELDINKSLFLHYDMTSIDFIDFAFELKKKFSVDIDPDELWPVNKMATSEEYYSLQEKQWTSVGLEKLNQVLSFSDKPAVTDRSVELKELYDYFTLTYVNSRIASLTSADN